MHIIVMNNAYGTVATDPDDFLERYHSLTGWAESLVDAGAQVTVLQRFHQQSSRQRKKVNYRFVQDHYPVRLYAWQIPLQLNRLAVQLARQEDGTIVHINGLLFPLQTAHLRALLPQGYPIVAQHHAEKPFQGWKGWLQRWGLASVDGFFFTSQLQAKPWRQAGVIRPKQLVFDILEGSTLFQMADRTNSRQRTGLNGTPQLLWVGRLDANKDPLTVLDGLAQALPAIPSARLAMLYHTEDLLAVLQTQLAANPHLHEVVTLVGRVRHDEIDAWFNSADYFVLGSHDEGSGFALIEALACGVFPIVTDIPSFRQITAQGQVGALWPVGDAAALATILRRTAGQKVDSVPIRRYFEQVLSYPAIVRNALSAYTVLKEQR